VRIVLECDGDVPVRADVGDRIDFVYGDGCEEFTQLTNSPAAYVDSGMPDFWFLGPAACTGFEEPAIGCSPPYSADAWAVAPVIGQTIPTSLRGTDSAGNPLTVGARLGLYGGFDVNTFSDFFEIYWAGPRTVAANAPIPAWVQAYGRAKDAICEDGWSPSWESWAEPVTGGWVCTRSIPSLG
jgi:hypothetical protein